MVTDDQMPPFLLNFIGIFNSYRMKFSLLLFLSVSTTFSLQAQNQDSLVKEAAKTEIWEPVPAVVTPGHTNSDAPSDAIILFNGKDMSQWQKKNGKDAQCTIDKDGSFTIVKGAGDIATRKPLGNCQLHIEWRSPATIAGSGQTRGNSGVYLMGRYELQVLDGYQNPTYVNGQAGSIYKQYIPLVNA